MIKVTIVDDNENVRSGLALLIDGSEGFKCISTHSSCESLLNRLTQENPDVILMDIQLPGISGIEGVRRIKRERPDIHVIMLTVYEDNQRILDAIAAGASGYVAKRTSPAKLLDSIRDVYNGGASISATIARRVMDLLSQYTAAEKLPAEPEVQLSEREQDILSRIVRGHMYDQIADELHITVHTVKYHVRKIYDKFQAGSKSELIAKAVRQRVV